MRLDVELRDSINVMFDDLAERKAVAELLTRLDEADRPSMVIAREINGPGTIAEWILVVTCDAIGYGWPMREVLWRSSRSEKTQ